MRAWEKEAAEGEDFSLNAFTAKTTEGRPMTHAAAVYGGPSMIRPENNAKNGNLLADRHFERF